MLEKDKSLQKIFLKKCLKRMIIIIKNETADGLVVVVFHTDETSGYKHENYDHKVVTRYIKSISIAACFFWHILGTQKIGQK